MSTIEHFNKRWDEMFERFKQHTYSTGSQACPPSIDKELNRWIDNQRILMKTGQIASYRREQLEDFGFYTDERDLVFDQVFNQLVEYRSIYGHLSVSSADPGYSKLAGAVQRLRNKYKRGQLKPEWIERLESIDFSFNHSDAYWEKNWVRCSELICIRNGKLNRMADQSLKEWYRDQVKMYKTGRLNERKMKLMSDTFEEKGLRFT